MDPLEELVWCEVVDCCYVVICFAARASKVLSVFTFSFFFCIWNIKYIHASKKTVKY